MAVSKYREDDYGNDVPAGSAELNERIEIVLDLVEPNLAYIPCTPFEHVEAKTAMRELRQYMRTGKFGL